MIDKNQKGSAVALQLINESDSYNCPTDTWHDPPNTKFTNCIELQNTDSQQKTNHLNLKLQQILRAFKD